MRKENKIALVVTILLMVLSLFLLQLPCKSTFALSFPCTSQIIYLIFNFPAVFLGLQLINNSTQNISYVHYTAILVNAIWWFFLVKYLARWKLR